jgi:hypothetical protein
MVLVPSKNFPETSTQVCPEKSAEQPVHQFITWFITWFNRPGSIDVLFRPKKYCGLKPPTNITKHGRMTDQNSQWITRLKASRGLLTFRSGQRQLQYINPKKRSITPGNTYLFGDCYNRLKPILIHFSKCISQK